MSIQNNLLLLSGNDIPFEQAQLIIHQPTIKQIAFLGQNTFYEGCEYLIFSKDKLKKQDKLHLVSLTDFEVLMAILKNKDSVINRIKNNMELVLLLLFPEYKISFLPSSIMLSRKIGEEIERKIIDKDNFESFKGIVSQMFCLDSLHGGDVKYNPGGPQAMALVKKFQERRRKLAEIKNKGRNSSISIIFQYVSILAVGQQKDMNSLLQYTIFQLFDQYKRFKLRQEFKIFIEAKIAGAKDLKDVNWMKDLYSDNDD